MAWFVSLFAVSTLASQSLMDLFATLICVSVVFYWVRRLRTGENWRSLWRPIGLEKIFILWLVVVGLSFAFSPLSNTDWAFRFAEFRWIFIFYCLAWAICELGVPPQTQKYGSLILGACSLYAIVVWFLGFDPINPGYDLAPWSGGHRTGGLLSNAIQFGHVYGLYFCLVAGPTLLAIRWRSYYLKYLLPALLLTGVAVVLSFTRGIWIGMAAALVVMAFVFSPRLGVLVSALGALAVWVMILVWPTMAERVTMAVSSGDERTWIWQGHAKIFLEHPVLGVGYGENNRMIADVYRAIGAPEGTLVSHAHNQYLHFLAGTGVVGLIVYLLVLAGFWRLTYRTYRRVSDREPFKQGLMLGCLGAQVAFFVGGLTESNFEHSKLKFVMMLIWALVIWQAEETRILRERA